MHALVWSAPCALSAMCTCSKGVPPLILSESQVPTFMCQQGAKLPLDRRPSSPAPPVYLEEFESFFNNEGMHQRYSSKGTQQAVGFQSNNHIPAMAGGRLLLVTISPLAILAASQSSAWVVYLQGFHSPACDAYTSWLPPALHHPLLRQCSSRHFTSVLLTCVIAFVCQLYLAMLQPRLLPHRQCLLQSLHRHLHHMLPLPCC